MGMARVTVGMSVYNGEAMVGRALEAVFAQTYKDFEVVAVDDGSTDSTNHILKQFPCRVISIQNGGLGAARKLIVEEAKGELIAFVDYDDFWEPQKLERQIPFLDETGADLVHSDGWYLYEDGRKIPRDLNFPEEAKSFDHVLPGNLIIASTAVFRRQAMLNVGNFVRDTVRCSDWYGWLRLAPRHTFAHLPEKLVGYSVLSTSLANSGYRFHAAQEYLLSKHVLPNAPELFADLAPEDRERYLHMVHRDIGIALSGMAKYKLAQGERGEARKLAFSALRQAPDVIRVWTRAASTMISF
jgi:glycosyltransferase involved in cell wall biosynthesis